jgi:hypothetical protein
MLLPMLSACNDNSGEQNTTEQPTSEQTEEPGASGSDTHSTEPPANTNTEPADTADQTTAPDTESDTASDTESDTEFDTETDTEQGTEPPPAEQSWTLPILRVNTTDGHDVTSKEHYKTCTVTECYLLATPGTLCSLLLHHRQFNQLRLTQANSYQLRLAPINPISTTQIYKIIPRLRHHPARSC